MTGSGTPTGTVAFHDGTISIGTGTLSAGQATLSTSTLSIGTHSITAIYQGDATFEPSTSPAVTQTVAGQATSTSVASSANPSAAGQALTFTATVTTSSGTPTGTVTFFDDLSALGTGALSAGQATFTTPDLAAGSHAITATYSGDATFATSTSAVLTQTVNNAPTTTALASSRIHQHRDRQSPYRNGDQRLAGNTNRYRPIP